MRKIMMTRTNRWKVKVSWGSLGHRLLEIITWRQLSQRGLERMIWRRSSQSTDIRISHKAFLE